MKFYFEQVCYGQYLLLWEMCANDVSARAVQILDLKTRTTTAIIDPDIELLNFKQGISLQDNGFFIGDIEQFIREHSVTKIEVKRLTLKATGKDSFFSNGNISKFPQANSELANPDYHNRDKILRDQSFNVGFTFSLAKLFPHDSKESTVWGATMASSALDAKKETELLLNKSNPITTELQLLHLKKMEFTTSLSHLKNLRIKIIEEIVNLFFESYLLLEPVQEADYNSLCNFIIQAIKAACTNRDLDMPLDHEVCYKDKDITSLSKLDLERIETSKKLELLRAKIIIQQFEFENLPVAFRRHIEKANFQIKYTRHYQKLLDNILETGQQLRLSKEVQQNYQESLRQLPLNNKEYMPFESLLEELFLPNCITESNGRQLLVKNPKYTASSCQAMLIEKVVEAIFVIDSHPSRTQKNLKPIFNHHVNDMELLLKNPRLFVKSTRAHGLLALLKKEFITDEGKGSIKQVSKNISHAKVEKFAELLMTWIDHPTFLPTTPSPEGRKPVM